MAIPKIPDPPGTGRTLRCVVEKDGQRSVVTAYRTARDAKTDEVHFPAHLYLGDGFTLLAMEGEPDFNSLAEASTTETKRER